MLRSIFVLLCFAATTLGADLKLFSIEDMQAVVLAASPEAERAAYAEKYQTDSLFRLHLQIAADRKNIELLKGAGRFADSEVLRTELLKREAILRQPTPPPVAPAPEPAAVAAQVQEELRRTQAAIEEQAAELKRAQQNTQAQIARARVKAAQDARRAAGDAWVADQRRQSDAAAIRTQIETLEQQRMLDQRPR